MRTIIIVVRGIFHAIKFAFRQTRLFNEECKKIEEMLATGGALSGESDRPAKNQQIGEEETNAKKESTGTDE